MDVKQQLAKKAEGKQEKPKHTKSMDIADLIKAMQPEIKKALPSVITPERFTRMALNAISNTPKLQECTPMSFIAALMNAAQLGLEPNTPLAVLQNEYVPYQVTCCNDVHEIGHIVDYFHSRTKLGEKLLILLDNLDAHLSEWNKLAQYMQSDVKYNYKWIVTSRENDWYNYGGDISNIHSMKTIKPILLEKEAEGIFYMLQAAGHIHPDISDWRKPWSMIVDKKLLIEYVYLLTHGEIF